MPHVSPAALDLLRAAYGLILLGSLLQALPQWRRFFLSERWGGYGASSPAVDAVQNPAVMPLVLAAWLGSAACLAAGIWSVPAALLNAVLCYYFFIFMRWRGLLRGMGAPGFMLWWLGTAVLLVEYARTRSAALASLALLAAQVDFAIIMITAGIAKIYGGYARGHGMELGLANPMWGYWWARYGSLAPSHWLFRAMNHLGWSVEIVAGVLMLFPATRALGGFMILASFVFIAANIRLSLLCETVIVCCFLFWPVQSAAGLPTAPEVWLDRALEWGLWAYIALRPAALAGLSWNYYGRRSLPGPVQWALDRYANLFGIILWRVFTADIVDFHIRIFRRLRGGGPRTELSRYDRPGDLRFNHVGEAITVTSLFTALRYFPDRTDIFEGKLLRYAATLGLAAGEEAVFVLVVLRKAEEEFEHVPAVEFIVDPASKTVREARLDEAAFKAWVGSGSAVLQARGQGSYAPAGATGAAAR